MTSPSSTAPGDYVTAYSQYLVDNPDGFVRAVGTVTGGGVAAFAAELSGRSPSYHFPHLDNMVGTLFSVSPGSPGIDTLAVEHQVGLTIFIANEGLNPTLLLGTSTTESWFGDQPMNVQLQLSALDIAVPSSSGPGGVLSPGLLYASEGDRGRVVTIILRALPG